MIPVVSVVGRKNSGKTTLLEKLIPELKRLGVRVGVVKHDVHGFEMDHPGTDTYRVMEAGADAVAISGPTEMALRRRTDGELPLAEVVERHMHDVDLVLTEGYKRSDRPKIEVATPEGLLCGPVDHLVAVVGSAPPGTTVPVFDRDDAGGLARFLAVTYLEGSGREEERA